MCATERARERAAGSSCLCVFVFGNAIYFYHTNTLGTRKLSLSPAFSCSFSLSLSLSFICSVLFLFCGQLTNVCGQNCIQIEWLGPSTDWLTDWLINRLVSVWVCARLCRMSVCVCGVYKKLITFKLAARLTFQFTGKVRRSFILNLIKQLMVTAAAF